LTEAAKVANYSPAEIALGVLVACLAQLGGLLLLRTGGGTRMMADISDERARPMSVAITPVVDDAPLLKLGTKKQPGKLPDRWIAPRAVERTTPAAFPSPHATAAPHAIPTVAVADAGQKPPTKDTEIVKQADLLVQVPEAGAAPVSTVEGAVDGVKEGTETDPLKAHAVDLYRSQLVGWFMRKFDIRGKVPFETLKTLRASAVVTIGPDRTVTSFTISKPSGNDVFDAQVRASLESIVSSGAELPAPPQNYPDILKSTQPLNYLCTNRSACE
jgi:hypothetical protein